MIHQSFFMKDYFDSLKLNSIIDQVGIIGCSLTFFSLFCDRYEASGNTNQFVLHFQ